MLSMLIPLLLQDAAASEPVEEEPGLRVLVSIDLGDGRTLDGRVSALSEDEVTLQLTDVFGEVTLDIERLTPESQYVVMRAGLKKGREEAHLRLAEWALKNRHPALAAEHFAAAQRLDPESSEGLQQRWQEAKARAGQRQLEIGRQVLSEGRDPRRAIDYLSAAVESLEDPALRSEASELLEEAGRRDLAARSAERMKELRDELRPVMRILTRAEESWRSAKENAGDLGDSEDSLLDAREWFGRALERLRKFELKEVPEPTTPERAPEEVRELKELREQIAQVRSRARHGLLTTTLDLGHHAIVAGDVLEAHRYASLAETMDLDHPRVLGLRRAIAAAQANGPWRRRRR